MRKLLYVSFAALAFLAIACKKETPVVEEAPVAVVQEEESVATEEATETEATEEDVTTEEATDTAE